MSRQTKGLQGWKEFLKLEISQMISQAKGKGLSKEFFELVKQIGEAKSKQEEDTIIKSQIKILKTEMSQQENAVRTFPKKKRIFYFFAHSPIFQIQNRKK